MKLRMLVILAIILAFTCKTFGQEQLLAKGNKVFILANDEVTKNLKEYLQKWHFWQVVDNKRDADFIMKFYCIRTHLSSYAATAEFINPSTNETFKMGGSAYSLLSTSDAAELVLYNEEQKRKD